MGEGALAERLRSGLEVTSANDNAAPATVVETTGTVAGLEEALAVIGDLGTIVLAGPAPTEPATIDCYPDLHLRGITVIGVADDQPDGT
jgi:threonine dehydrogenase-like Zn-dependent dehydrogenase